jgi:hypothetical protein
MMANRFNTYWSMLAYTAPHRRPECLAIYHCSHFQQPSQEPIPKRRLFGLNQQQWELPVYPASVANNKTDRLVRLIVWKKLSEFLTMPWRDLDDCHGSWQLPFPEGKIHSSEDEPAWRRFHRETRNGRGHRHFPRARSSELPVHLCR